MIRFRGLNKKVCDIQCHVPSSTLFHHKGLGVVIGEDVVLGENCKIWQCVTIGAGSEVASYYNGKSPVIGDNVMIMPFCIITGDITIGDNVIIGSFSYVNKDVPSDSVVYGIPMKIKTKVGIQ